MLPIVFLVIFAAIFTGYTQVDGRPVKLTTYYVPGIMTLGIISASFVNLTVAIVTQRESGVLKRARATPVPAGVVITSRAAVGVLVALVMSALLLAIGHFVYDVRLPGSTMPAVVMAVIVGAASFCCLSFAVSSLIGAADAAPRPSTWPSCPSTSSRVCSSPRARSPPSCATSPISFRSATYPRRCCSRSSPHTGAGLKPGTWRSSPPGGSLPWRWLLGRFAGRPRSPDHRSPRGPVRVA